MLSGEIALKNNHYYYGLALLPKFVHNIKHLNLEVEQKYVW